MLSSRHLQTTTQQTSYLWDARMPMRCEAKRRSRECRCWKSTLLLPPEKQIRKVQTEAGAQHREWRVERRRQKQSVLMTKKPSKQTEKTGKKRLKLRGVGGWGGIGAGIGDNAKNVLQAEPWTAEIHCTVADSCLHLPPSHTLSVSPSDRELSLVVVSLWPSPPHWQLRNDWGTEPSTALQVRCDTSFPPPAPQEALLVLTKTSHHSSLLIVFHQHHPHLVCLSSQQCFAPLFYFLNKATSSSFMLQSSNPDPKTLNNKMSHAMCSCFTSHLSEG